MGLDRAHALRAVKEWNEAALARLETCATGVECGPSWDKLAILNSWHFVNSKKGGVSGEDIWLVALRDPITSLSSHHTGPTRRSKRSSTAGTRFCTQSSLRTSLRSTCIWATKSGQSFGKEPNCSRVSTTTFPRRPSPPSPCSAMASQICARLRVACAAQIPPRAYPSGSHSCFIFGATLNRLLGPTGRWRHTSTDGGSPRARTTTWATRSRTGVAASRQVPVSSQIAPSSSASTRSTLSKTTCLGKVCWEPSPRWSRTPSISTSRSPQP